MAAMAIVALLKNISFLGEVFVRNFKTKSRNYSDVQPDADRQQICVYTTNECSQDNLLKDLDQQNSESMKKKQDIQESLHSESSNSADSDQLCQLDLDLLFQEPTKFQQIVYCLDGYVEKQDVEFLHKLFNVGVLGVILASIISLALFLEKCYQFMVMRIQMVPNQAIQIYVFCYDQCMRSVCCIPYLIFGEGYIMQHLFREKIQDVEQRCQQSSWVELQFAHYCTICMESKQENYMAALGSCCHRFCKRCLAQYIQVCIQSRRYPLPCPQCSVPLSFKNVNRIISTTRNSQQLKKLLQKYQQDHLVSQKQAFYCPNPHCESIIKSRCQVYCTRNSQNDQFSAKEDIQIKNIQKNVENYYDNNQGKIQQHDEKLQDSDNQVIVNFDVDNKMKQQNRNSENQNRSEHASHLYSTLRDNRLQGNDLILVQTKKSSKKLRQKCLSCHMSVCMQCKSIQHDGLRCEEFQFLNQNCQLDTQMTLLFCTAERLGFGQCPECKQLVEKMEGCDHIHCYCGTEFLIDRTAIRHGRYYKRPLWMYGKNMDSKQHVLAEQQIGWLQVDLLQNYDELYPSQDIDREWVDEFTSEDGQEWGEDEDGLGGVHHPLVEVG
eukprot:TRINITY_DN10418_c0_g1_i1.p1 TRINITY_DN10418_c0_g1~~TRINITY_DN10418_c0_g1_i1.p1  ORF type:complete len:606 (-),score=49.99 TRINITY_DN10418_c0_g1_i1:2034-3851(-)